MKKVFVTLMLIIMRINSYGEILDIRGVVYDVGLRFGGNTLSVPEFDRERVAYDMSVIANILECNSVRVEGEDIDRIVAASREAHKHGLRVFFNPWKHGSDSAATVKYVKEAAKKAEVLRKEGMDIVFVAGCEYSLFNKGVFPGDSFDDRMQWLMNLGGRPDSASMLLGRSEALNRILNEMVMAVREEFNGQVTYSSGTWEIVDWSLFDIIGIDYYRNGETPEEYIAGLDRYVKIGKPVVVMEMGSCAYKGAAERGSFGFAILQGTDDSGCPVYEGGAAPGRDETVQADYIASTIELLRQGGADGVFVYVFSFPIYPYDPDGTDYDMTSYALVKSFTADDPNAQKIPAWRPKQAFFRLGEVYSAMNDR